MPYIRCLTCRRDVPATDLLQIYCGGSQCTIAARSQPLPQPVRFRETKYGKRHRPGEMNKTEAAYTDLLEARKLAGEVTLWHFEAVTLKLADATRYTPDFLVMLADRIELIDAKGGGPIDPKSKVKIKCAAERFPCFHFAIEQKTKEGWKRTEY